MKKSIISLLVVLAMTVFVGTNSANAVEPGYVSVNTSSEIDLVPDVVDFSVEVVTTSKESMAKAIAENKRISGKVYEDIKKTLDKNAGDSVKTSNFSTTPVYRYNNNKRVLDYYQVTNNVKVHTKKISEVGKMIDTATSDGATSINGISYTVSKYDNECGKLLADAAKKAKEQADIMAGALGSQVTGVKYVDGSCSLSGRTTMPRMMLMAKSAGQMADEASNDAGVNIEVGTMKLYARVNAQFFLK